VISDLRHATGTLPTSRRTVVMGVLNVTPDSFSDGGVAFATDGSPDRAVGIGLALTAAGADCIDVGGESTRPGSEPTPVDEQLTRVVPVIEGLVAEGVVVSVDTRRTVVASAALSAGASLVNDVGALAPDDGMLDVIAAARAGYVIMHLRGEPSTMQSDPRFADVVEEVAAELAAARTAAVAAGVASDAIALDPGYRVREDPRAQPRAARRTCPRLTASVPPVLGRGLPEELHRPA
jgi:dihydropteroate synthase